jgi:hypothetical protein
MSLSDDEIMAFSSKRAEEVEAACWSPRLKISDQDYHSLTLAKAGECTSALCRRFGVPDVPHASSLAGFDPPPQLPMNFLRPPIPMIVAAPVVVPPHLFIAMLPPRIPTPIDGLGGPDGASGLGEEYQLDWYPGIPSPSESLTRL